jgi:hypothetical protein
MIGISDERRLGKWELDSFGAATALAIGVLSVPLGLFVSQILVRAIPLVFVGASGLYLLVGRRRPATEFGSVQLSASTAHVLRAGILVGLAGMVFVGTYTGGRTVPFLLLTSVVGSAIFTQILLARDEALRPSVVLAELLAFSLIVRGTALLTMPGLVGVDTWTHVTGFAQSIQQAGHLGAISDSKYYAAPLYHLFVVIAAEAFNSSLRTALFATLGIVLPVSTLLIYFTARYFLAPRWALFGAATYGVSDHVVHWAIDLIPTSMGLVFFLAVFYLVAKTYVSENRRPTYVLAIFFSAAVVFTHQISAFITLVFLGSGALADVMRRRLLPDGLQGDTQTDRPSVNFATLFVLLSGLTVVNWTMTPAREGSFLMRMIGLFRHHLRTSGGFLNLASASSGTPTPEPVEAMLVDVPLSVELIDSLGFLLLLFVALVGSFALLRRSGLNSLTLTWVVAFGLMALVTLGTPLFGLYTLVPSRWYAFMYAPMAVVGAVGLKFVYPLLSQRAVVAGMLVFALLFPGAMLVSHKATPDNAVFDDSYVDFAYSEAELEAADTIAAIHPDDGGLQTDHPYRTLFDRWQNQPAEPFNVTDDGTPSGESVVYRDHQTTNVSKMEHRGVTRKVRMPYGRVCSESGDTVYTIGTVQYCRNT